MKEDLLYKIAITKIPDVGPVTARLLIESCGSAEAVFQAKKRELLKIPGIGSHIADSVISKTSFDASEFEVEQLIKHDIKCLFYKDSDYPERLRYHSDAPIVLYYKGSANLNHPRNVAIIGTRKPTFEGKIICDEIIAGLKKYDVQILSGLAYGIDITAHKKALTLEIPTIGVLGHGLSMIYPSGHKEIALQMLESGGLLTEFPFKAGPDRENFPMRNRIVAALCDALIVVETAVKGGSIITTEYANNYNKDVFAIPGRISDQYSAGCNRLIKINKASLLEKAEDIGYIMRWESDTSQESLQQNLFVDLNETELKIVNVLKKFRESSFDRLAYETELQNSQIASLLLNLEFKGIIKSIPGKRFILI